MPKNKNRPQQLVNNNNNTCFVLSGFSGVGGSVCENLSQLFQDLLLLQLNEIIIMMIIKIIIIKIIIIMIIIIKIIIIKVITIKIIIIQIITMKIIII